MPNEWKVVAQGGIQELREKRFPATDIPPGTRGQVIVSRLPWHLARTFDLLWIEQTLARFMVPKGVRVIDAYEEGGKGYIDFETTGTPLFLIIAGILPALIAIGIGIGYVTIKLKGVIKPETPQQAAERVAKEMEKEAAEEIAAAKIEVARKEAERQAAQETIVKFTRDLKNRGGRWIDAAKEFKRRVTGEIDFKKISDIYTDVYDRWRFGKPIEPYKELIIPTLPPPPSPPAIVPTAPAPIDWTKLAIIGGILLLAVSWKK